MKSNMLTMYMVRKVLMVVLQNSMPQFSLLLKENLVEILHQQHIAFL